MELRSNYNSGRCNAVIFTLSDARRITFMDDFVCNASRGTLARSHEAVLKVPVALPARPDVAPALSYWMKDLYYETQRTYLDYEEPYHRPPGCAYTVESELGEGAVSLGISQMSGVLLILVVAALLAVLVKLCCTAADVAHERSSRSAHSIAPDASKAPDESESVSHLTLAELREVLAAEILKARPALVRQQWQTAEA